MHDRIGKGERINGSGKYTAANQLSEPDKLRILPREYVGINTVNPSGAANRSPTLAAIFRAGLVPIAAVSGPSYSPSSCNSVFRSASHRK